MKKPRVGRAPPPATPGGATDSPDRERTDGPLSIVGVGASAGGLEAFTALLAHLPLDTGMGFVLVQHLDPEHESALTQLLGRATALPVHEVTADLRVEPNHVYVIAPNTKLSITAGVLTLHPRPQTRAPHRPIDVFLEALAEDQHERAIGVILSGTATDGTLGLEAIKAEGGITFAQDDSARYDSMPRSAVAAGSVDFVLSPEQIAHELARIARHPYVAGGADATQPRPDVARVHPTAHDGDEPSPTSGSGTRRARSGRPNAETMEEPAGEGTTRGADDGFKKILRLLRNHSGVDFSLYKPSTIQRRFSRRMVLNKHDTLEEYAQALPGNAKELDALYSDTLISVTGFFRNPEAFEVLKREVWPTLLRPGGDDPLRVWVLGCSTGQEAYSIAMSFVEGAEHAPRPRALQVFATDLNEVLLDKARYGLYTRSLAQDISPERLRRFFVEEEGGYRVTKALREMVVFARQNVISDPPFSRMDLISCRNLLIYLEPSLQRKVFPVFHYALKPGGFLFLGASESIGGFTELFDPVDKKQKIYIKKAAPSPPFQLPARTRRGEPSSSDSRRARPSHQVGFELGGAADQVHVELNAQREADRVAINQFAPPAVLINADLQILQFRGPTGAYLEPPSGKATFEVLKMARGGLMLPLRTLINKAKKDNTTARKENIRIEEDDKVRTVNLEVIPLKNLQERCFLVVFEDAATTRKGAPVRPARARRPSGQSSTRRIAELEAELAEMRDYLQSVSDQHEAANEELQASNEEVQSANEELQSINEELETSKEELESANEELTTINEEMASRNAELNRLNSDLVNIQTSTHLAMILVGRDLAIRRFSTQAEKQLGLLAADVGRPISTIRHDLDITDLDAFVAEAIDTVRAGEREVQDKDGRWLSLRVRPYLTLDRKVDGAVLVLVDVTDLKRSELAVAAARDYAENIIETVREPLLVLDRELRVERANRSFYGAFGLVPEETVGKFLYDLGDRQWNNPELRTLLETIVSQGHSIEDFSIEHHFVESGRRTMLLNARRMHDPERSTERILLVIEDITERKQAEERYRSLTQAVTSVIWTTDAEGRFVTPQSSWSQFTGQTWEQLRDFGWLDALHPDDRAPVRDLWEHALRDCTIYQAEGRIWHAGSSTYRHFEARGVPIMNADGSVREWVGQYLDVEDRARAEEARAVLAAIVESSDEAIVSKDLNGVITTWNRGATRLFGYTAQDMVGQPVARLIPTDRLGEEALILERIGQGETVDHYETIRRRKDGTLFDVSVTISPIRDKRGKVIGASKIAHDITERKRAEEALLDSDRHKNEFLATLAHELRNPLAPIRNALGVMRRAGRDASSISQIAVTSSHPADVPVPDAGRPVDSALDILERQVDQMVRLVDDLLDVGRISRGKLELRREPVELSSVLHHTVEAIRPLCDAMGQSLTVALLSEPVYLNADPARIAQVVGNLLNNASKFTDRGGHIWLTVERGEESRVDKADASPEAQVPHVVIRVRDTGIGIAAEQLPRVFDMFTQVDTSLERSRSGLGIGLTLVRTLVHMHGGTVTVSSAGVGKGSEFAVRLPTMADTPTPTPPPFTRKAVPVNAVRILVVDDNRDSAESLAILLQFMGHDVHMAHDGLEAVEAAARIRPAAILLDIGLPGINGYEAARRIRQQQGDRSLILVALTGWGQEEDRRRSEEAGFDAHLVKPVNDVVLGKLLAELNAKKRNEQERLGGG